MKTNTNTIKNPVIQYHRFQREFWFNTRNQNPWSDMTTVSEVLYSHACHIQDTFPPGIVLCGRFLEYLPLNGGIRTAFQYGVLTPLSKAALTPLLDGHFNGHPPDLRNRKKLTFVRSAFVPLRGGAEKWRDFLLNHGIVQLRKRLDWVELNPNPLH